MKTKTHAISKLLTEAELELMQILWKLKEGSVSDVLSEIKDSPKPAYTTVSTLLRILTQKEALKARKEGRGHIYIPLISKQEYEAKAVKQVIEKVFEGTPVTLVKQLLDSGNLNPGELEEIRSFLNKMENRK